MIQKKFNKYKNEYITAIINEHCIAEAKFSFNYKLQYTAELFNNTTFHSS